MDLSVIEVPTTGYKRLRTEDNFEQSFLIKRAAVEGMHDHVRHFVPEILALAIPVEIDGKTIPLDRFYQRVSARATLLDK